MKQKLTYGMLLGIKAISALFYRYDIRWIGELPPDPWTDLRLVVLLNHTSLYEPLFAGFLPPRFLKTRHVGVPKDDIFTVQNVVEYRGNERPACEKDPFLAP